MTISRIAAARVLAVAVTALSLSAPVLLSTSSAAPVADTRGAVSAPHRAVSPPDDHVTLPSRCHPNPANMPDRPLACYLNTFDKNRPTMLLWGDSHAWMFIPALKAAAAGKDVNLVAVVKGTCPAMTFGANPPTKLDCYQFNKIALDLIKRVKKSGQPLRVVLGASWQRYLSALDDPASEDGYTVKMAQYFKHGTPNLMTTLGKMHVRTDVIGQVGYPQGTLPACDRSDDPYACDLPRSQMIPDQGPTRTWLKNKMKALSGSPRYIDVNGEFCGPTVCHGFQDPVYTFFDNEHLSLTFSKSLKPLFTQSVP
ncbi:SGNH hydrolase domain-containing protein [Nocardioides sp.]|jgi:hypothetical protein|uniref:SGNH hydrolase domain-containing protein n=1 Tax=Nocardioides sp. TaxID=35761 RepID=UPI0031FF2EBE|nr:putative peptidoglycan O-acetyltransferase YrhL [Nocardioides sp.]